MVSDILIRNLPKRTVDALKARARRHGRSLQAEVVHVLEHASVPAGEALFQWLSLVRQPGLEAQPGIDAIREDRDSR